MSSRSTAKYDSLALLLNQMSTEQNEALKAQNDRLDKLETLVTNLIESSPPTQPADERMECTPESDPPHPDLMTRMEEMMDAKISAANKEWSETFERVIDANQNALLKLSNERWEALDRKIESQFEVFEARTKAWPEFMSKIDRLLEAYPISCQRDTGNQATPVKRQKVMSSPASPGDRVTLE